MSYHCLSSSFIFYSYTFDWLLLSKSFNKLHYFSLSYSFHNYSVIVIILLVYSFLIVYSVLTDQFFFLFSKLCQYFLLLYSLTILSLLLHSFFFLHIDSTFNIFSLFYFFRVPTCNSFIFSYLSTLIHFPSNILN